MDREYHSKVDNFFWNREFPEVHQWLDEACLKTGKGSPYRHWLIHHHLTALHERYPNDQLRFNAAYLHILSDYLSHFNMAIVPINEEQARLLLMKLGAIKK